VPDDTPTRKIAKVGVIGADHGRRHHDELPECGNSGDDARNEAGGADKGIADPQELRKQHKKGKLTQEKLDQRMGLLTGTLSYDDFKDPT